MRQSRKQLGEDSFPTAPGTLEAGRISSRPEAFARGLLLGTGEVCVRLPSTSSPEGKVVGPAALVRMPFGDPLSLRGRRRRLGVPSGVTWLLGQQG